MGERLHARLWRVGAKNQVKQGAQRKYAGNFLYINGIFSDSGWAWDEVAKKGDGVKRLLPESEFDEPDRLMSSSNRAGYGCAT